MEDDERVEDLESEPEPVGELVEVSTIWVGEEVQDYADGLVSEEEPARLTEKEKMDILEQMREETIKEENAEKSTWAELFFSFKSRWQERSRVDKSTMDELEIYLKKYRDQLIKDDFLSNTLATYLRTTYPILHPYSEWLDVWSMVAVFLMGWFIPRNILLMMSTFYVYHFGLVHSYMLIMVVKFLYHFFFKGEGTAPPMRECTNVSMVTLLLVTLAVISGLAYEYITGPWFLVALIVLMMLYLMVYLPTLIQKSPTSVLQYTMLILFMFVLIYFFMTPPSVVWMQLQFPLAEVKKERLKIQKYYNDVFLRWLDGHISRSGDVDDFTVSRPKQALSWLLTSYQFSNIPNYVWSLLTLFITHLSFKCLTQATSNCNAKTADCVVQVNTKKEDRIFSDFDAYLAILSYPWYFFVITADIFAQTCFELPLMYALMINLLTSLLAIPVSPRCMQLTYMNIYERTSKSLAASDHLQNKNISYGYFPNSDENHKSLKYYNSIFLMIMFLVHIMPRLSREQNVIVPLLAVATIMFYVLYISDKTHKDSQKYLVFALCVTTNSFMSLAFLTVYTWYYKTSFTPFQEDIRPTGIPVQLSDSV